MATASIGNTTFGYDSDQGTSHSATHDNNGSVLVAFITCQGTPLISGTPTYAGQAMTLVDKIEQHGTKKLTLYCYLLVNPATGSNTLAWNTDANEYCVWAIYSIPGGAKQGDSAKNSDLEVYNIHAQVTTRDSLSMILSGVVMEAATANNCIPNNLTEDYEVVDPDPFNDGRCAFGHVQGTGGTDDPWWNWSETEDAGIINVEVLGYQGGSQPIWIG